MTNMTQASATEKKGASDLLRFKIFGMPLPLYAFALITLLLSHFYNAIPTLSRWFCPYVCDGGHFW